MKSSSRYRPRPLSLKAKLIGAAVGLSLAWAVTAISVAAGHGENVSDAEAPSYASTSQAAATVAAVQHLEASDPAGAKVFAREALAISPVAAAPLRTLGFADQLTGQVETGNALLSQAAALGWRDVPTQLWLAQAFSASNDDAQAVQRFDAALRVEPSTQIFDMLDKFVGDKAFARAAVERLSSSPSWRTPYLRYVGDDLDVRVGLLADIAQTGARLDAFETLPAIQRLIEADRAGEARTLWLGTQHIVVGPISDPRFEKVDPSNPVPFEWTTLPVLGANVATDSSGGQTGVKLTSDGSASGTILHQLIVLGQGAHELSFAPALAAADGKTFGWAIRCRKSGKTLLNTIGMSAPYRFDIPEDCNQQFIELRVGTNPTAAGKSIAITSINVQ